MGIFFLLLLVYILQCHKTHSKYAEFKPCLDGWIYSEPTSSCYWQPRVNSTYNFRETRDLCKSLSNSSDLLYLDEENEEEELYQAF